MRKFKQRSLLNKKNPRRQPRSSPTRLAIQRQLRKSLSKLKVSSTRSATKKLWNCNVRLVNNRYQMISQFSSDLITVCSDSKNSEDCARTITGSGIK